jgi:hypothetical protein
MGILYIGCSWGNYLNADRKLTTDGFETQLSATYFCTYMGVAFLVLARGARVFSEMFPSI